MIQAACGSAPGVTEACVYALASGPGGGADSSESGEVSIAAALVVTPEFDISAFQAHLAELLPASALPAQLRLETRLPRTGSGRYIRARYRAEGSDPRRVRSPMLRLGPDGRYAPVSGDVGDHASA